MTTATMNFGQTLGLGVQGRENDRDGKSREVFLSDGQTIRIESRDPYGLWYVVWSNGKPPEQLSGQYTHPETAYTAVVRYLAEFRYNTKVVPEKVDIPEIKFKSEKKVA